MKIMSQHGVVRQIVCPRTDWKVRSENSLIIFVLCGEFSNASLFLGPRSRRPLINMVAMGQTILCPV